MSNRFHNKFHRENHHSKRTSTNNSIVDASYDPIASYSAPFQGEFYTDGEIVTNSFIQAVSGNFGGDLDVGDNLTVANNATVANSLSIGSTLNVSGSGYIANNFTIAGDLTSTNVTATNGLYVGNNGYISGNLTTTGNLTSNNIAAINNLNVGNDGYITGNLTTTGNLTSNNITSRNNLLIVNDGYINGNLTVSKNLSVLGDLTQLNTNVLITSSVEIASSASGSALKIAQTGAGPLLHLLSPGLNNTVFNNDGYLGLGTYAPNKKLTVIGSVSATDVVTFDALNTGTTDSVVTELSGTLQKRTINSQVWNASSVFVTSVTSLSVGYIQKAVSSTGLGKSVIYEDASNNIGIGTITPTTKLDILGNIRQYSTTGNSQMTLSAADSAPGTLSFTRYYNNAGYTDVGQSMAGPFIDTAGQALSINNNTSNLLLIDPTGSAKLQGNFTVTGNLSVFGDSSVIETTTTVTSAFSITNSGSQPALIVNQTGSQDIAYFRDDGNMVLSVKDGGKVGVNTNSPNYELTVVGSISATGNIFTNSLKLSSITITGETKTSTTAVTASDLYLKVAINGTTKYLRLFDVL